MPSTIIQEKKRTRSEIRQQIAQLTMEEMALGDEKLFASFLALSEVAAANTILLFWGMAGVEPDTIRLADALITQGKKICMPRMRPGHQMEHPQYHPDAPYITTPFGILEPAPDAPLVEKTEIDLVLVPALCYNRQGYRMGFGGGYYDRWLENFSGVRVGFCREELLREDIPLEPHDTAVDILITEEKTTRFVR